MISEGLEGEALDVDVFRWHVGPPDSGLDSPGHDRRSADIYLAVCDVWNQLTQVLRREEPFAARRCVVSYHIAQANASVPCKMFKLVSKHEVFVSQDPVDEDEVSRHVLDQRTDWRNADSACYEGDSRAGAK